MSKQSVAQRTGLADPYLRGVLDDLCASVGVDPDELSPLYTQLSLAALHQAEVIVLTYLVSHLKNGPLRRHSRGRKAKNKGDKTNG